MSIQGSLKTLPFSELLSNLRQLRKTGILSIVTEFEERMFIFWTGNLVSATAENESRRLGSFLVRLGIVGEDELALEIGKSTGSEIYFGQRLVETGRITAEQLQCAVRQQVLEILEEVLSWQDGAFHFDDNELPFAVPEGIPFSTQGLLLEATSKADERHFIRNLFPDLGVIPSATERPLEASVGDDVRRVFECADGNRSIEAILFDTPLRTHETARVLHDLIEGGFLRLTGIQVTTSSSPSVPEFRSFPVSPDAPGRLLAAFQQDSSRLPKLREVLEQDPLLATKALRALTLKGRELPREQTNLEYLVSALGTFTLRSLLVPEAVRGIFFPRPSGLWNEMWQHSVEVAALARELAEETRYPFPEEAYLAGLLHNLGAFVLMSRDNVGYADVLRRARLTGTSTEESEEAELGISHSRLGGTYALKWNFPRSLTSVIRQHHHPEAEGSSVLLGIVAGAIGLVATQGTKIEEDGSGRHGLEQSLRRLGINRRKALSLLERRHRSRVQELSPIVAR